MSDHKWELPEPMGSERFEYVRALARAVDTPELGWCVDEIERLRFLDAAKARGYDDLHRMFDDAGVIRSDAWSRLDTLIKERDAERAKATRLRNFLQTLVGNLDEVDVPNINDVIKETT